MGVSIATVSSWKTCYDRKWSSVAGNFAGVDQRGSIAVHGVEQ